MKIEQIVLDVLMKMFQLHRNHGDPNQKTYSTDNTKNKGDK